MKFREKRDASSHLWNTTLGSQPSRRDFMVQAIATGVTISAATLMWERHAQAATPKRGGRFRVGVHDSNTTDNFDPATLGSEFSQQMSFAARNCLTELLPDGSLGGEIAENWEATADARSWRFSIRQGVEFHNGKSLEPEDVRQSLLYHLGEDSISGGKVLISSIQDIVVDGNDIVISTSEGYADLPYALALYSFAICPSLPGGGIDISGVGTGAYILREFEAGVRASFERNPNYFKAGRGNFDQVELIGINDPSTRSNALLTNEVDAISDLELQVAGRMGSQDGIIVDEVASGAHATMPMFVDTPPFDNLDVRLALKYAIDREEAVNLALKGHGSIGNDQPISPTMPYYSEIEQRAYDPEKAKYHLKKSGHEGLKISLSASDSAFSGAVDLAILFSEQAKRAGIDVEVVREPKDGYWSNVWLKKPFCVSTWSARPTPDVMFTTAYKSDADWNESRFRNERFDWLLQQGKSELDQDKRTSIYREMMEILRDDGGTVIPFFRNRVMARRDTVDHEEMISGNSPLDGSKAAERWWFKDV